MGETGVPGESLRRHRPDQPLGSHGTALGRGEAGAWETAYAEKKSGDLSEGPGAENRCSSDHMPCDQDRSNQKMQVSCWTSSFRQYSRGMAQVSLPPPHTPGSNSVTLKDYVSPMPSF